MTSYKLSLFAYLCSATCLLAAPPSNDNLANATVISGTSVAVSSNNTDATLEPGEVDNYTIWWKWTAPATGRVSLDSLNSVSNNLAMRAYLQETVGVKGGFIGVAGYSNSPSLSFPVSQGTTIIIQIATRYIKSGSQLVGTVNLALNLNTADPVALLPIAHTATMSNDAFSQRITLTGNTVSAIAYNESASNEASEPSQSGSKTFWWKYRPTVNGRLTISSQGSGAFEKQLGVYIGTSLATLRVVDSQGSSSSSTQMNRVIPVTAGTDYQISLGSYYTSSSGSIVLSLTLNTQSDLANLNIPQPATMDNDNFTGRLALSGNSVAAVAYNTSATIEAGEPSASGSRTFWWTYRPSVNGRLTISSQGTAAFEKRVAAYLGSNLASLRTVDSQGSSSSSTQMNLSFPVTAGTDYQISFGSYYTSGSGAIVMSLSLDTAGDISTLNIPNSVTMSNDNFADSLTLVGDVVSAIAYNASATIETGEPASSGSGTFWWKYRPSANGRLTVTNQGSDNFDIQIAVYLGSTLPNLRLVSYAIGYPFTGSIPVTAGVDYLISTGSASARGSIVLSLSLDKTSDISLLNIPGPATVTNDNFVNRVALPGNTVSAIGYNSGASREALEPTATEQKTLWWSWTAASSGQVTVDFVGSGLLADLKVSVWTGTSISALTGVSVTGGTTSITFAAISGVTYQIAVGCRYTQGDSIVMTIYGVPSKPVFSSNPMSRLVAPGTAISLSATVDGTQRQWLKNGTAITRATAATYDFAAALTNAAAYTMKSTNALGFTLSTAANIGVVNTTDSTVVVGEGATLSLTASAAGPSLKYRWRFGTQELFDAKVGTRVISGAATAKLSITAITAADAGAYTCLVSMTDPLNPDVPLTLASGAFNTTVVSKPVVAELAVPAAAVSRSFSWQLTASGSPTGFIVSGLPTGLTVNASTGLITGIPIAVGQPKIKVSAKNVAGTGAIKEFTLNISSLPEGVVGIFSGHLSRQTDLNSNLGGWFTVTVGSTGSFTGSLKNGLATYAIKGRLDAPLAGNPSAVVPIPRTTPLPPLNLTLTFTGSLNSVSAALSNGSASATGEGRRHIWTSTSATAYAAAYNSVVELPLASMNDTAQPLGSGWQQMTISKSGVVSGTGRTADGISYTFSGTLWPNGSLPQYSILYTSKTGSITGLPRVSLGADLAANRVSGWVEQIKNGPASSTDRTYRNGIPLLRCDVDGAPWIKPTTLMPVVMELPDAPDNADVTFTKGGIESAAQFTDLDQVFRINKTNTTTFKTTTGGNPSAVTMKITATTGLFTGSFTLTDTVSNLTVKRPVSFSGIMLSHRGLGFGYFTLNGLSPSSALAPILSGRVLLD